MAKQEKGQDDDAEAVKSVLDKLKSAFSSLKSKVKGKPKLEAAVRKRQETMESLLAEMQKKGIDKASSKSFEKELSAAEAELADAKALEKLGEEGDKSVFEQVKKAAAKAIGEVKSHWDKAKS